MADDFDSENLENKIEENKERDDILNGETLIEKNIFNTNEKSLKNFTNSEKNSDQFQVEEKKLNEELEISLRNLAMLKKEHKYLNNQLHILSHKVQYKINPLKRKTFSNLNTQTRSNSNKNIGNTNCTKNEVSLPIIVNKNLNLKNDKKTPEQFEIFKNPFPIPKFKYEDTRNKILKSKQILEENKQMRIKQAKQVKEANRLMRENVLMLKEKIKEENRQKKKIVDTRYELIKNSISNFQKLKQDYIKNIITTDIEKETKEIIEKRKQLKSLKESHEINLKIKNKNKEKKEIDKSTSIEGCNGENQNPSEAGIYKFEESKNEEIRKDDNFEKEQ